MREKNLIENYKKYYNASASDLFSSSGRIELLGHHTDHNHGRVLVGAVNLDLLAAVAKTDDDTIIVYSEGYSETKVSLNDLTRNEAEFGNNIALVKGCVVKLKELGYKVGGFKAYVNSILPAGSGISSSAAYECLIVEILNYYYNNDSIPRFDIVRCAQFAESIYFGKPCGLLDQCGVAFGGINKIDFSDISNPKVTHLEFNFKDYSLLLINTGGSHSNLTDEYAAIPKEMKEVANFFGKEFLNEVDEDVFYSNIKELRNKVSDRALLRAVHFFNENKIVDLGFNALLNNDTKKFLHEITESGLSSYRYLQNTCVRGSLSQNINVGLAMAEHYIHDGAYRVHGGGFEGTVLCFVNNSELETVKNSLVNVFGDKNIHKINIRNEGSYHIKNV